MKRLTLTLVLLIMVTPVAYAGHSLGGSWCECGTQACFCDPGETPNGIRTERNKPTIQPEGEQEADKQPLLELAGFALVLGLFFMRLRGAA